MGVIGRLLLRLLCSRKVGLGCLGKKMFSTIWRNRALRTCLFLYAVTFLVVLPILCQNSRFSWYFFLGTKTSASALEEMKMENNARLVEAEKYLQNSTTTWEEENLNAVDVAITIITVSRNRHVIDRYEPRFLTQVVHRYLEMAETLDMEWITVKVFISVCNVDRDPNSYKEAQDLSQHVHVFQRFRTTSFPMVHYLEKEKQDYAFCLNYSINHSSAPKFVLLVEDDALPKADLPTILSFVLFSDQLEESSAQSNIAYVKLFHPERLLSYNVGHYHGFLELLGVGILLGAILTFTLALCVHLKKNHKILLFATCVLYFVLVQLVVGRPYMEELRRYFPPHLYTLVRAPSCCTPAMLFPASSATSIVKHLSDITCGNGYGKDSAMETVVEKLGLDSLYALPNAFSHIGFYSALRDNVVDPFVV